MRAIPVHTIEIETITVKLLYRLLGVKEQHSAATALIEEFASKWLADHGSNCRTPEARSKVAEEARNPVRQMLMLAATGSVSAKRQPKPMPFQTEALGFLQYLREEQGLRESSVRHYIHHLHRLAGYLDRAGVISVMTLSPPLLAAFIIDSAPTMAKTSRRDLCGVIRVFLRYCHREKIIAYPISRFFRSVKRLSVFGRSSIRLRIACRASCVPLMTTV